MNNRKCVNCGAVNEIFDERCRICGRLVGQSEEPDPKFSMKCKWCGKIVSVRNNICPYCDRSPRSSGLKEFSAGWNSGYAKIYMRADDAYTEMKICTESRRSAMTEAYI